MGMLHVGRAQYLTLVGPGGAQQPFIVHAGDHVLDLSVAIAALHLGIKWLQAGRQNYRSYLYFYLLRRLLKINGVILTDAFAYTTFLLFDVKTAVINICNKGDCL
jgi:hypothetical protein